MKKQLLSLTLFALSMHPLSANSYSWTGSYLKLMPAYSNLNLNYSGETPHKMTLKDKSSISSYYTPHNDSRYSIYNASHKTYKIAEKVSANTMTVDYSVGLSYEASNSFGLIGEIGGMIGKSSNFIDSTEAIIFNTFVTAGLFYYQPSFRIYGMGGFGIGEDIFGYPKAIDDLQNGKSVYINGNKSFVNSNIGFTYRGSIGFEYKIDLVLLGISYNYTRSVSNVALTNDKKQETGESFYISNHSFAAMIGVHI